MRSLLIGRRWSLRTQLRRLFLWAPRPVRTVDGTLQSVGVPSSPSAQLHAAEGRLHSRRRHLGRLLWLHARRLRCLSAVLFRLHVVSPIEGFSVMIDAADQRVPARHLHHGRERSSASAASLCASAANSAIAFSAFARSASVFTRSASGEVEEPLFLPATGRGGLYDPSRVLTPRAGSSF
jgi:hypothetical protein